MTKRTIFVVLLLAGIIAFPAIAQDFTSPKAQFLSFSFGVPIGYDLNAEEMVAGSNFGIGFAVIENLTVAYDYINVAGAPSNLIRLSFSFAEQFGAAIGFGSRAANPVACLGVFGNFFQARAASGLVYGLGIRLDYLTPTSNFGDGTVLFNINASFGL